MKNDLSINELTSEIIGAAIKVHRALGPGLLESAYERCLGFELSRSGFHVLHQEPVPIVYGELQLECGFRADLLIERRVIVECKSKEKIHPIDKAQTLSHLRLLDLQIGLLINFNVLKLVDGIHRIANDYRPDVVQESSEA